MKKLIVLFCGVLFALSAYSNPIEPVGTKKICIVILGVETICVTATSEVRTTLKEPIFIQGKLDQKQSILMTHDFPKELNGSSLRIEESGGGQIKIGETVYNLKIGEYNIVDGKCNFLLEVDR